MTTTPATPHEGIYYVVREPDGWRVIVHLFVGGVDRNHVDMWEEDVVPALVRQWEQKLAGAVFELDRLLSVFAFAFPRGRVTKVENRYVIYHGNDLRPAMRVSRAAIEKAFGVTGLCRWQYDDHERCVEFEKDETRQALQLTEDWPAAESFE